MELTRIHFTNPLKEASFSLLDMVRNSCWNNVSNNVLYILSEIKNDELNPKQQLKIREKLNNQKNPISLEEVSTQLQQMYDNLYDINLEIYYSKRNLTIIEIRYYLKSSLDTNFLKTVINTPPMLHCKVGIPPYAMFKTKKYDVNWHLGGIKHQWKLFLHNCSIHSKNKKL